MFEKTKDFFARQVNKILEGFTPKEHIKDTKAKTNQILTETELAKQRETIRQALFLREEKLHAEHKSENEVYAQKDSFRQRMYKATSKLNQSQKHEKEQANTQTLHNSK